MNIKRKETMLKIVTLLPLVIILAFCSIILESCNDDQIMTPLNKNMLMSIPFGTVASWDEEIIDSNAIGALQATLTPDEKIHFTNRQYSKWHVTITIPDTCIKNFRIERTLLIPSSSDSAVPPENQIWRTVTYGTQFSAYDKDNVLLFTKYLDMSSFAENLSFIPIEGGELSNLPDSIVSQVVDSLNVLGFSVSVLANHIEYISNFTEEGKSTSVKVKLNKSNLTESNSEITVGSVLKNMSNTTYQTVNNYSAIASRITYTFVKKDTHVESFLNTNFSTIDVAPYMEYVSVEKIIYSNIQF